MLNSITKNLYPTIAKNHQTTPSRDGTGPSEHAIESRGMEPVGKMDTIDELLWIYGQCWE